jgi:hypothetical protein
MSNVGLSHLEPGKCYVTIFLMGMVYFSRMLFCTLCKLRHHSFMFCFTNCGQFKLRLALIIIVKLGSRYLNSFMCLCSMQRFC